MAHRFGRPGLSSVAQSATVGRVADERRLAWRIERYGGDGRAGGAGAGRGEEARYAVYRGDKRVAWGLRERGTAIRWVQRLGGAAWVPALQETDASERNRARPWWNG